MMHRTMNIRETIKLHRLHWFGHVQGMEGNRILNKCIVYEFGINKTERETKK
jgi:hypothetical protein